MDNGTEYEFFKPIEIEKAEDFENGLKNLGFFKDSTGNDRNFIVVGQHKNKNTIIREDKVSSFEFIPMMGQQNKGSD